MFLEWAAKAEQAGDYLAARMNYLKCVEDLKMSDAPKADIEAVNRLYEAFVQRDPIYKKLIAGLLPFIKANPGVLQSDMTKHATSIDWPGLYSYDRPVTKEDLYYALYFADKQGLITRIKKGRSYELRIAN